mgnify:FL=1
MNQVVLIGRLVADPVLRYTQNGLAVASFTLAVDRGYTTQDGEKQTDFINIVAWRKLAEVVADNLQTGRLVAVVGSLQIRSYDDQNGIRRKAAEVVANQVKFLDYAKDKSNSNESDEWSEFEDVPF